MSRSLNRVELIGHVGQDPEGRTTVNGSRCATFSLATSREWKNAAGEKQEKTEWHRCVVWNSGAKGGLADVVGQYVTKGDKLFVAGRIEYRQWTDKENNTRYATEIVVNELLMLSGKQQTGARTSGDDGPSFGEMAMLDGLDRAIQEADDLPF